MGPKGTEDAIDVICDLHNTTANMGLTVISYSYSNWICLHMFKYLQARVVSQYLIMSLAEENLLPVLQLLHVLLKILMADDRSRYYLVLNLFCFLKAKITTVPVRLVLLDIPVCDAYSLESVGKYGICKCMLISACQFLATVRYYFTYGCVSSALEVGPQPQGVVRADIFNVMKDGVDAVLDWIKNFNSGTSFDLFY